MPDRTERALTLVDRARAAGINLRAERKGLMALPAHLLDPDLKRELSAAHDDVLRALRAENGARAAIRRARSVSSAIPARPQVGRAIDGSTPMAGSFA